MADSVIEVAGACLSYGPTRAVVDADLTVRPGESVALMGASGCGKSSLVHLIAGVLPADAGSVVTAGGALHSMSQAERGRHRLARIGMVFQFGGLVPELTLAENVMLPLQLLGDSARAAAERAAEVLGRLGVADVADRRAGEVSGGQAQRAAVARALVHSPPVLIADEPTASLDSVTADEVMRALVDAVDRSGAALLVATHDNRVAAHCSRLVTMVDGRVGTPDRQAAGT